MGKFRGKEWFNFKEKYKSNDWSGNTWFFTRKELNKYYTGVAPYYFTVFNRNLIKLL